MPEIAVVIPARNAAATIGSTLEALVRGERPPDEIVVADGLSGDATAEIARRHGAVVVPNPKRHAAGARQAGVQAARASVIAFTDADCLPARDWLVRIAAHFDSEPDLVGVGGKIVLPNPRNDIQAFSARVFETIMQFPDTLTQVTSIGMRGALAGANCAYRKGAIISAGGFRDEFSNYAEEIDLFWRLLRAGTKLLFDPSLRVDHLGYPSTYLDLIVTNFRYGITSTKLAKYHIRRPRIDVDTYRLLLGHLPGSLLPGRQGTWHRLTVLQLSAFISGKIISSARERTINL